MNPHTIRTFPRARLTATRFVAGAAIGAIILVLQDPPQPTWVWLAFTVVYLVIEAQVSRPVGSGWIAGVAMAAALAPEGAMAAVLVAAAASEVARIGRRATPSMVIARVVGHVPPAAAFLVVAGGATSTETIVVAGAVAGAIAHGTTTFVNRWVDAGAGGERGAVAAMEAVAVGAGAALLGAVVHALSWPMTPVVAVGLVLIAWVEIGRRQLDEARQATVGALLSAIEAKDVYTRGHSERVAVYARWLGAELGLRSRQLRTLHTAALLHDVGKLVVPRRILRKRGTLTDAELTHVARHVTVVPELLDGIAAVAPAVPIVACHHLHFGGGGYGRDGLSGYALPIEARILAVADAFDAMTTHRPYRRALSVEYATMELERCAGTQFDPQVVSAFVRVLSGRRPLTPVQGFSSDEAARLEAEGVPLHV